MTDMNSTHRSDYSDDFENDVSMLTGDEDNEDNDNNNDNNDNDNNDNNDNIYDNDNFESDGDFVVLVGRPIEHLIQVKDNNNNDSKNPNNDDTKYQESTQHNTTYNKKILSIERDNKNKLLKPRLAVSPNRKDATRNTTDNSRRVAFTSDTNVNKTNSSNKYKRNINKNIKDKKDNNRVDDDKGIAMNVPNKQSSSSSSKDIFDSSKFKLQIGSYPDTNAEPETVDTPRSYYGISPSPINKLKLNLSGDDPSIHLQHVLKKQLDTAIKKIQILTKERAALTEKLDADNLGHELDKMRDIISQQDRLIKKLKNDNYGLSLVTRNQARLLAKEEVEEDPNSSSNEAHIKILVERVRRLGNHLSTSKTTEKKAVEECEGFKKLYSKYRSKSEQQEKIIAELSHKLEQKSVSELSQSVLSNNDGPSKRIDNPLKSKRFLDNNYNNPRNPPIESALELELSEIANNENANESKRSNSASISASKDQPKTPRIQKSADDNYVIEKLHKAIRVQRVSFTNEMNNLKGQITTLKNDNSKLREELEEREKESRMHVIQIRQLRKKYDDLLEGNNRLKVASNVYSSMEEKIQIPVPNPKPPSVPSTRNSSFRKSNPNHHRAPPLHSDNDIPKSKLKVQNYTNDDRLYDDDIDDNEYLYQQKSDILTEQYSDEFTEYLPDDGSSPPTFFITSN